MNKNSIVFINNYKSLIGAGLAGYFKGRGFTNLILVNSSEVKFDNQKSVYNFFRQKKIEYCFLLPIAEGGILANINYPANLIYENLLIQTNIIHSAYKAKVKRLIYFASSCVYPKNCPQPIKEEYLLQAPLELTNEPYAVAKIAGIKMCQAYNKQYHTRFISVIPATIFGPNDSFDYRNSHVMSALIRKFHEAKVRNKPKVIVWGTGRPKREFIYIDELVDACLFVTLKCKNSEYINIGTGQDISIYELAKLIKKIVGFKGKIEFDTSKPDGVLQKLLDNSKLASLGWKPKMSLEKGIENTYNWYKSV